MRSGVVNIKDFNTMRFPTLIRATVIANIRLSIEKNLKIWPTSFLSPEPMRKNFNVVIKCGLKFDLNCFDSF